MFVTVTAGHSNTDSGAVGNGFKENEFVTNMRNYIVLYLKQADIEVKVDGTGSTNDTLRNAVKLVEGSKLAIELHLNASTNSSAYGVEILSQTKDIDISQRIAKAIVNVTGSKLRGNQGWKPEDSGQHKRLAYIRAGGLIVELEFISNSEYMNKLNNKRWLVAKAIANEIIKYVKGEEYAIL